LLDENEVIEILCRYLESEGATVLERRSTSETGIDVVCRTRAGRTLHIEAKGSTSSRAGSPRHSKPFTNSQVFDRVAKGVYTAIASLDANAESCLAFPDEPAFLRYVEPVATVLAGIGVTFFAVSEGGVRTLSDQQDGAG
jgi:hypothetical protein